MHQFWIIKLLLKQLIYLLKNLIYYQFMVFINKSLEKHLKGNFKITKYEVSDKWEYFICPLKHQCKHVYKILISRLLWISFILVFHFLNELRIDSTLVNSYIKNQVHFVT